MATWPCDFAPLDETSARLIAALAAIARPDHRLLADLAGDAPAAPLREVALQAIPYAGFPRALRAFEVIREIHGPGPDDDVGPGAAVARGEEHFRAVYRRTTEALRNRLRDLDPLLERWTVEFAYGRVLGRPGLSPRIRELCGVAALSVLDQPKQMLAHAHGARHFGARVEEIVAAARLPASLWPEYRSRAHDRLVAGELASAGGHR